MSDRFRVNVGSQNAAKLEAVRRGLEPFFPGVELAGFSVASGVSEQPVGFDEILSGARNRARRSFAHGNCELGVGIEDGLIPLPTLPTGYVNLGCCVLHDGARDAYGLSSGFEYPPACVAEATGFERVPIGDVFDRVFAARHPGLDPGLLAGNIGRLTEGVLTRAEYGSHAVMCAMVRLLHPELYAETEATSR